MFVAEYGESGAECFELASAYAAQALLGNAPQGTTSERAPARRRTHPLTWVVAAALLPVLCWDAWQSLQEAKLRLKTRDTPAARVEHTAVLLQAHTSR